MEKLNALVAFLGSFGSIFDVGDYFYKKKLWNVKILTFEEEA